MHLENLDVLVTGATGFVGSRVAKTLHNTGANVTILTRKKMDCPYNVLVADLADKNLHFEKTFDVVCHLASHTPLEKDKKILYAVNYEGVKNLYNSLKGTKLFIYVSGLAVFDPAYSIITEDTPKKYDTAFVKMRIKAQEFLEENCKKSGIRLAVAYLGDIVYGNGGFFKIMISERLKKGTFRIPGDGKYIKNLFM